MKTTKKPNKIIKGLIKKAKARLKGIKIKRGEYDCNQIFVPIMIDGVLDKALWDQAKQAFTELHLTMNASKKAYQHEFLKDSCYTDKIKTVVIDLETERIIKEEK